MIRQATVSDAAALNTALAQLSQEIGDTHRGRDESLSQALERGIVRAVIAGEIDGAALYSPVFSTTRGAPGLYVSDLWVSREARGTGQGRKLLRAAAEDARAVWGASWLKLTVYGENNAARAFYDRVGFHNDPREHPLSIIIEDLS